MGEIKNLAIIQARMGANRLPGKVMFDLAGKTVLEHVVTRVKHCKLIDKVMVATTTSDADKAIVRLCLEHNIQVYQGSENDVLDRYYMAATQVEPSNVIRITADCPLIDPNIIQKVVEAHLKNSCDYTANIIEETFPDGQDVEVMKFPALTKAWKEAALASEREHVTLYIRNRSDFSKHNVKCDTYLADKRWTLDEDRDYQFISAVYEALYPKNPLFGLEETMDFLKENPKLEELNHSIKRNMGLAKSLENDYRIDK